MWTGKKTKLFAERNSGGRLVLGEVVIDDFAHYCHTFNTPLGVKVTQDRPIYREVLRSVELTEDQEDYYWDILSFEDPWYDTEDRAILYFLEGRKLPSQERYESEVALGMHQPHKSWIDHLLEMFGRSRWA